MEEVSEGTRFFTQLCNDPENQELATNCVLYFDHLLAMWQKAGAVLLTRKDHRGPNTNVYILKPQDPAKLGILGANNQLVEIGLFSKRSAEIVGVYSEIPSKLVRLRKAELFLLFISSDEATLMSRTFQGSVSERTDLLDQRAGIVVSMAKTAPLFIQSINALPPYSLPAVDSPLALP